MNGTNGQTNFSDEDIRHYLLRQIAAARREAIERQLLADDLFFERVEAASDDLIEDYATGKLTADERRLFEKNFLVTEERRENLKYVLDLRRYAEANKDFPVLAETENHKNQSAGFFAFMRRPAFAFAALCLIVFGALLFWNLTQRQSERQIAKIEATPTPEVKSTAIVQPEAAISPTPVPLQPPKIESSETPVSPEKPLNTNEKSPAQSPVAATLILSAGALRSGGETPRLALPKNRNARVNLALIIEPTDRVNFRAEILTAEGRPILTRSAAVKSKAEKITISVPAKVFQAGDYQVKLSGVSSTGEMQSAGRYYFRVRK